MANNSERIDELIEQTQDPVQRATLLVLSRIDTALDLNTSATQRLVEDMMSFRHAFQSAQTDEVARLSSLQGGVTVLKLAMPIVVFIVTAVNSVGGYLLVQHYQQNAAQDAAIAELQRRVSVIEAVHGTNGNGNGNGVHQ